MLRRYPRVKSKYDSPYSKTYKRNTISKYTKRPYYPRYKVLPYNTDVSIQRSTDLDIYLDLASGWNQRGPGFSLIFSLSNVKLTFTDGFIITSAISGSTELSNLYDQWKVDKVDLQMFFSATTNTMLSTGIITSSNVMPVISIVNDFDNNDPIEDIAQYPQVRTLQLGTTNGYPLRHTIYKPGAIGTTEETVSSTVPGQVLRGQWFSTATPGIPHHCMKVKYNEFSTAGPDFNPANIVGALKLRVKVFYSMRNPR